MGLWEGGGKRGGGGGRRWCREEWGERTASAGSTALAPREVGEWPVLRARRLAAAWLRAMEGGSHGMPLTAPVRAWGCPPCQTASSQRRPGEHARRRASLCPPPPPRPPRGMPSGSAVSAARSPLLDDLGRRRSPRPLAGWPTPHPLPHGGRHAHRATRPPWPPPSPALLGLLTPRPAGCPRGGTRCRPCRCRRARPGGVTGVGSGRGRDCRCACCNGSAAGARRRGR